MKSKFSPFASSFSVSSSMDRQIFIALIVGLGAMLGSQSAHAAVKTWVGGTAFFNDGANWNAGTIPVSADSFTFGAAGVGGTTLTNDLTTNTFTVAGITFNAGAPAYTLNAASSTNTFILGGAVPNNSTSLQTINNLFSLSANRTFTTTAGGGDFLLGGEISGSGGITKAGDGTLTLTAANTFTGASSISGGTLVAAQVDALTTASQVSISTTGGAGTLQLSTDTSVGAYKLGSSSSNQGTIVSDRATAGAGITHALGAVEFGSNTYNIIKGTNVKSGTAGVSFASYNLSSGSAATSTLNPTTASLTILGATNIGTNNQAKTLGLDGENTGNLISGVISNGLNTLSVTKSNTSTWTLSADNLYSGITTVTSGTLALTGNNSGASGVTNVSSTGILRVGASNNFTAGVLSLNGSTTAAATLLLGNDASTTFSKNVALNGVANSINTINVDRSVGGSGTNGTHTIASITNNASTARVVTVTGSNGYSLVVGNLNLNSGNGQNTTLNANTNVTVNNVTNLMSGFGSSNFDTLTLGGTSTGSSVIGVIKDAVGGSLAAGGYTNIVKNDAGTWTLSAANMHTGSVTVNGGTLVAANVNALSSSSQVSVNATSNLRLATDTTVAAFPLFAGSGSGRTITSDRATAGAGITHVLGTASLGNSTYTFQAGSNVTSGTAGISLASLGMGGGTAGSVVLNPTSSTLTIVGGVTSVNNGGDKTLNLGGTNTGHSVGGAISDGVAVVSLTKSGTSTWSLSGNSSYTGPTAVDAGTLRVSGSIDNSAVTVSNAGTTLASGATGTIGKSVSVGADAILDAGGKQGLGKATVGVDGLSFSSGSIFAWDLAATLKDDAGGAVRGSDNDAVNTASLAGSDAIFRVVLSGSQNFAESFWDSDHTWANIFKTADGGSALDIASVFTGGTQYYNGSGAIGNTNTSNRSFTMNGSTLSWSAVPEPTSALAGILLFAGLARRRRTV